MNGFDPVEGYLELKMADEAMVELEEMSAVKKKTERYAELLLTAQMMLKHWGSASVTAAKLCERNSEKWVYFIHSAYCLHEVGDTERAMQVLESGPKELRKQALYHYNMACYYAVLEEPSIARSFLREALRLDNDLLKVAEEDPDLVGVDF